MRLEESGQLGIGSRTPGEKVRMGMHVEKFVVGI